MRIGCCVPAAYYAQAVKDGLDYVELPAWEIASMPEASLRELSGRIAASGVPCARLNAYCTGTPAIVGPAFEPEAVRSYAERLFPRAAALGVHCVGVGAPPARLLPEGYDVALADHQCREFLRITAEVAFAYGIDVLLEALQSGVCNYINHTEQALEMVQALAMENVALVVDLYHMETQGESWTTLRRYIPRTRHMHVSTVGPGLRRGLYRPGDEAICARAFTAIAESGYTGTVSMEPDPQELTPGSVQTALEMIRRTCIRA